MSRPLPAPPAPSPLSRRLQVLGWCTLLLGTWLVDIFLVGLWATASSEASVLSLNFVLTAILLVVGGGVLVALGRQLRASAEPVDPRPLIRRAGFSLVAVGLLFTGYTVASVTLEGELQLELWQLGLASAPDDYNSGMEAFGFLFLVAVTVLFTAPGIVFLLGARLMTSLEVFGIQPTEQAAGEPQLQICRRELRASDGTTLSFVEVGVFTPKGRLDHVRRTNGVLAGQPISDAVLEQLVR